MNIILTLNMAKSNEHLYESFPTQANILTILRRKFQNLLLMSDKNLKLNDLLIYSIYSKLPTLVKININSNQHFVNALKYFNNVMNVFDE